MYTKEKGVSDSQSEQMQLQLWHEDRLYWQHLKIQELKKELQKIKKEVQSDCQGQSRRMSMIESFANIAVGFVVSLLANITILPLFGYSPGIVDASFIGAAFTVISLIRSYLMRRLFNWMGVKYALASK